MYTNHCKQEIPFARGVARCRGKGQNEKWTEPRPSEQGEMNTGGNARVSSDESQHRGEKSVGLELARPRRVIWQSEIVSTYGNPRPSTPPSEQASHDACGTSAGTGNAGICLCRGENMAQLKAAMIIDPTMMLESGDRSLADRELWWVRSRASRPRRHRSLVQSITAHAGGLNPQSTLWWPDARRSPFTTLLTANC